MAEGGKSESDLGAVLERMERKLQEVEETQGRAKIAGRVMALLVAVTAIAMVWFVLAAPLLAAWSEKDKIAQDALARAQERLVPAATAEAQQLIKDLVPIIEKAASESRDEHLPRIMLAVEKESRVLVENLVLHANEQSAGFLESFEQEQLAKLQEAFPKLKSEATTAEMTERLANAVRNVGDRLSREYLNEHFDAIARMGEAIDQLEVPADVAAMAPAELDEHIAALLLEIVKMKLTGAGAPPAG